MPLVPVTQLMHDCQAGGYAVGYFESWNLESLQGVIDAAERTRSPVIIGFNGEFLCSDQRLASERLAVYGALGKAAAQSSSVPCGLIFNECPWDASILAAIEAGFNLVMPTDAHNAHELYAQRVRRIVEHAHEREVAVEAELGELACGASGAITHRGSLTDPEVAQRFVATTGVDLLAVNVGNVHIQLSGEVSLDLGRLAAIHRRVPAPLVLHGGTGITADSLQQAIRLGVAKVNYGTYLKQRFLQTVRAALLQEPCNPHELLGIGGSLDVTVAGRHAVRDAVLERIGLLGCCGKAS
jgi:ketose-bisphosphate aldolase